jgi:hypothetical protein
VSAAAPTFVFLPAGATKELMDTMLGVFVLLMLIGQAFGGERMSCEVQPLLRLRGMQHKPWNRD